MTTPDEVLFCVLLAGAREWRRFALQTNSSDDWYCARESLARARTVYNRLKKKGLKP